MDIWLLLQVTSIGWLVGCTYISRTLNRWNKRKYFLKAEKHVTILNDPIYKEENVISILRNKKLKLNREKLKHRQNLWNQTFGKLKLSVINKIEYREQGCVVQVRKTL